MTDEEECPDVFGAILLMFVSPIVAASTVMFYLVDLVVDSDASMDVLSSM